MVLKIITWERILVTTFCPPHIQPLPFKIPGYTSVRFQNMAERMFLCFEPSSAISKVN